MRKCTPEHHRKYHKEYQRKYRLLTKEREYQKEYQKKYRKTHKEKSRKAYRKHYHSNKEFHSQRNKEWRKANPDLAQQYQRERRARVRGAQGTCSARQWKLRCDLYGWRCAYCRIILDFSNLTCDHQIPLSKGGSNWPSNLVPACQFCNFSKRNKKPQEFRLKTSFGAPRVLFGPRH